MTPTPSKGEATPKRPRPKARDYRENRNASATKSGPGRFHKAGKPGTRIAKARPARAYRALMAAWAQRRITKAKLHDGHGAYTLTGACVERAGRGLLPASREHLVGGIVAGKDAPMESCFRVRRKWLAGISAMRGY